MQQKKAVEHLGSPALVIAGAGSGKTRTLTAKINYLIKSKKFAPERILAITFTNKAADEMKSRLVELTGLRLNRFPWVRTCHSLCFQILKDHYSLLDYEFHPQIYAEYQQQKMIEEILLNLNLDKKNARVVKLQISKGITSGNPIFLGIRLVDIYNIYEKELIIRNAVDFDSLLLTARNLLTDHKNIRKQYQELFQYVLVDEYQDTNNIQEELTRLFMKNGNLFCVGDDWQAIYSFRGSNVNNFLSFPERFEGVKVFPLEQNFRSNDKIVQVANNLIKYNGKKMEKKCFSEKSGGLIELFDFHDETQEANWIAKKIKTILKKGMSIQDIAVLYRTSICSFSIELSFRSHGLPFQLLGGKGFYDRKEIKDIISYITSAIFEKDNVSFERILNTPKRGIGSGTIKKICKMKAKNMSLQDSARLALDQKILSKKLNEQLKNVFQLIDDIKGMKPDDAIREVINRVNYFEYLLNNSKGNSMDYDARLENIEQLVYSASKKNTIVEFLEEAALIKVDQDDSEKKKKGVILSTIHASKGLEYEVVFLIGCEEGVLPHYKSMTSVLDIEEERRLMYVAITRAKRYLYISYSKYRKGNFNQKSRFLNEIEKSIRIN